MTKLTRQHFRALAEAIAKIDNFEERKRVCDLIGSVCRSFNLGFSWSRFEAACNVVPRPIVSAHSGELFPEE